MTTQPQDWRALMSPEELQTFDSSTNDADATSALSRIPPPGETRTKLKRKTKGDDALTRAASLRPDSAAHSPDAQSGNSTYRKTVPVNHDELGGTDDTPSGQRRVLVGGHEHFGTKTAVAENRNDGRQQIAKEVLGSARCVSSFAKTCASCGATLGPARSTTIATDDDGEPTAVITFCPKCANSLQVPDRHPHDWRAGMTDRQRQIWDMQIQMEPEVNQAQIADKLGVSQATVSRELDRIHLLRRAACRKASSA